MTFINQLRLMTAITVVSLLGVIVLASVNLSRLRAEFAAYQSIETTQKALIDIKASALAVARDDPILAETADHLRDADRRIQRLLGQVGTTADPAAVAGIAKQWGEYLKGFLGAVKIASDSPADALNIPDAMYKLHLQPMVEQLDKVASRDAEREVASTARIDASVRRVVWIVLPPLLAAGLLVTLFQLGFNRRLKSRMDAITHEIDLLNRGDLSRRLPEHHRDEIGRLAGLINGFIGRLEAVFREVHAAAERTREAAQGIRSMTDNVTVSAKTQSEKFFRVSAAIEQMGSSIYQTASSAGNAAERAGSALEMVTRGNETGRQTIGALSRIDETVGVSAQTIGELNAAIQRIGEVSKAIEGIAEQTNLLALNAAIEAARAGEQGRGFAVVADEVRELSVRTAHSTADILGIVQTIQNGTAQASRAMEQAKEAVRQGVAYGEAMGSVLNQIDESVRAVSELMSAIAGATEEQSTVGRDISQDVDSVASITATTASEFDSTRSAMGDLVTISQSLHGALAQFTLAAA